MKNSPPIVGTTYQTVLGAVITSFRSSASNEPIKQADIAAAIGVTVSTWSRIERGESSISLDQLILATKFLNIKLSVLFEEVENITTQLLENGVKVTVDKNTKNSWGMQLSNTQLIGLSILTGSSIGLFAASAMN